MKNSSTENFKHGIAKPMLCDGFLIPMTDFVNNVGNMENYPSHEKALSWIYNYATFLKQHLKLEMFVPCDEDGNVLEEPKIKEEEIDEHTTQIFAQYQYDLDKAKEKVLFEGFNADKFGFKDQYYVKLGDNKDSIYTFPNVKNYTIEDLAHLKIELTENAIKQIGL